MNKKLNHYKNVIHGFFVSIATTIAEANTILPLIVTYFGGGAILVGFFSSLLRGGAILVQLYAAFYAQSYTHMQKYIRRVFLARFIAWFSIGLSIIILGNSHLNITLFLIGLGLFIFSFSAGFGAIYFKETIAKIFTKSYRGKSMATRQFFSGFGALLSGATAGYIIQTYEKPFSFGILFIVSSLLMGFGFWAFGTIEEPIKQNVSTKEKSFKLFLQNAKLLLKNDNKLQIQVITFLLSYSYLFSLPFIIIDASSKISMTGTSIASIITVQMIGSMLSNLIWGKLSANNRNKLISNIIIILHIISISLAFVASNIYFYMLIFFFSGAAMDGYRLSSTNLLINISPEDKRPVYSAIQANITSFGIFFSILGGVILHYSSYSILYSFTIVMLFIAFYFSRQLSEE